MVRATTMSVVEDEDCVEEWMEIDEKASWGDPFAPETNIHKNAVHLIWYNNCKYEKKRQVISVLFQRSKQDG